MRVTGRTSVSECFFSVNASGWNCSLLTAHVNVSVFCVVSTDVEWTACRKFSYTNNSLNHTSHVSYTNNMPNDSRH